MYEPLPWVKELLAEHNRDKPAYEHATASHVFEAMARKYGYEIAWKECYSASGKFPHEEFEDYKDYVRHLRQDKQWTYEKIAAFAMTSRRNVGKILDDQLPEKRKKHDADYWERLKSDPDKYEARKAAMREYSREWSKRRKHNPGGGA